MQLGRRGVPHLVDSNGYRHFRYEFRAQFSVCVLDTRLGRHLRANAGAGLFIFLWPTTRAVN